MKYLLLQYWYREKVQQVKFTLEQAVKDQRWNVGIALLFL
jgi:hypothetical protein